MITLLLTFYLSKSIIYNKYYVKCATKYGGI